MNKYLSVFKISFAQEFAYRINFIMWRVRNVIQFLLVFFLWSTVFSSREISVLGYNRDKILTYIFGVLVIKAIVFSARAVDVAGEISRGELTNYLLKPISYFKYWFTRDISSKALNLSFSVVEFLILYLLLRPTLFIQANYFNLLGFGILLFLAILLFFCILFLVNLLALWMPESGWPLQFLFIAIIAEFLSGGIFPLDIFPQAVQNFLYLLPFPYLVFFPLQVYLGKIGTGLIIKGFFVSLGWLILLVFVIRFTWEKGLVKYSAEGR